MGQISPVWEKWYVIEHFFVFFSKCAFQEMNENQPMGKFVTIHSGSLVLLNSSTKTWFYLIKVTASWISVAKNNSIWFELAQIN